MPRPIALYPSFPYSSSNPRLHPLFLFPLRLLHPTPSFSAYLLFLPLFLYYLSGRAFVCGSSDSSAPPRSCWRLTSLNPFSSSLMQFFSPSRRTSVCDCYTFGVCIHPFARFCSRPQEVRTRVIFLGLLFSVLVFAGEC